jgi:methionine-rich copper-binding protein CopC
MLGLRRPYLDFLATMTFLVLAATLAFAHAVLVEATPSPNGVVNGPNVDITLKFNVRVDAARSRLELVIPSGTQESLPARQGNTANILLSRATGLGPGKYNLIWQVLASDGHITRGQTGFSVK